MSMGQMIEYVKLACECKLPGHFHGRPGGMVPLPKDLTRLAKEILSGGAK